jgi:hypothetical protein
MMMLKFLVNQKNNGLKNLIVFFLVLLPSILMSQEYLGEAPVLPTGPKGFYRIKLTPELTSGLSHDCSNVRIFDRNGKEVQYMMDEAQRILSSKFISYPIVSNRQIRGWTRVVFANTGNQRMNHFLIRIKNAEVDKYGSLAGSDDQRRWYALKENFFLNNLSNGSTTSEIRVLDFPLSDYKYYQLNINDSTSLPLNILDVGYLEDFVTNETYTSIENAQISIADSVKQKQTHCHIIFDSSQWVDQIKFSISNNPFYKRMASLYEIREVTKRNGSKKKTREHIQSFEVSSNGTGTLDVKGRLAKDWIVVIDNFDNPPLEIEAIRVTQLDRYLVAYLDGSSPYTLKVGINMTPPVYELAYFKENIPENAPVIIPGPFSSVGKNAAINESKTLFSSRIWIWCGIVGIVLIMGWMSWGMIKETKSRKDIQP